MDLPPQTSASESEFDFECTEVISIGEFVKQLMELKYDDDFNAKRCMSEDEILRYGHYRLWLDDSDERYPEKTLNRQTAARIVHLFLRIECGVPDIEDIKKAETLKDLYNCRVCANHIAQVYLRNIMSSQEYEQQFLIFNHLGQVSKSEALEIIKKIQQFLA